MQKTTIAAKCNNLVRDKGKMKVLENPKGEKSCKMKVDPILEKEYLAVEAKTE